MDEKTLCPRLIDFVILVGRRANSRLQPHGAPHFLCAAENSQGGAQLRRKLAATGGVANPELLRRYPSENHRDFELPTDVTYFCQPEGCVTIGSSQRRWNAFRDTSLFVFTLTEKDSAKIRYGISLNFFLNCDRGGSGGKRAGGFKPANSTPTKSSEQTNNTLGGNLAQNNNHSAETNANRSASAATTASATTKTENSAAKRRSAAVGSSSLTSLCLISHHPFLSTFRDLLILLRQLIDSTNNRCNHDPTLPKNAVWTVLMGYWSESGRGPLPARVMDEIRQLETWILMLLSSPVPVPGKTKVVIEVLPANIMPVVEFALPDHTRFTLVDFPLHLPIELLGVDVVIKLLAAIMLEHKVVLQSRNYNAASMCVLALVALMYPLEYMFPVIPLLPVFMPSAEQLLLAPTPYIIGVPASFFIVKNITVPPDVLLVDLDTNELTVSAELVNIPQFPEPEAKNLKEAFRKALGKAVGLGDGGGDDGGGPTRTVTSESLANLSQSIQNLSSVAQQQQDEQQQRQQLDEQQRTTTKVEPRESNEVNDASGFESGGYVVDNDEIDVAVRVAMVQFYDSPNIFANFNEHARTLRLYPRPVVALQTESFLRSRPTQNEFIGELCKTQSVEYFAESSLCPRNETYVRIDTGVTKPSEIGDKAKWFSDQLMPIHFNAYPNNATLASALAQMRVERPNNLLSDSDDEDTSDLESSYSGGMDESLYSDSSYDSRSSTNFERYKPLSELAADYYNAPKHLKLPQSHSGLFIDSSPSSGRSSPDSPMSLAASVVDSEADFVRLAQNLALKSDSKGEFSFDHSSADEEFARNSSGQRHQPPVLLQRGESAASSASSSPIVRAAPFKALKGLQSALTDSATSSFSSVSSSTTAAVSEGGKKVPQLMGALNGYAEKSQGMLSQMFRRTAPKAQALRDKTMRPLAEAAATRMEHGQHLMQQKTTQNAAKSSTAAATQQRKGQETIAEVCEQVLAGQSIGVFTYPKVKRLLEDENLRELACSKLNLNLENRFTDDDLEPDVQLTRNQYKGYLKLLVACVVGLEQSFRASGSNGLASMFHVLEIALTHYWAESGGGSGEGGGGGAETPSSGQISVMSSPTDSTHNMSLLSNKNAEGTTTAKSPHEVGPTASLNNNPLPPPAAFLGAQPFTEAPAAPPPLLPPQVAPPPLPPQRPPPLPPRQQPNHQAQQQQQAAAPSRPAPPPLLPPLPPSATGVQASAPQNKPDEPKVPATTNSNAPNEKNVSKTTPPQALRKVPSPTLPMSRASNSSISSDRPRHFLCVDLLVACAKAELWQNLIFWENAFFDKVAQEREIIGMDQEPAELIDRYAGLNDSEKKRLELDEDRILATLLHNLTSYMMLSQLPVKSIQQKVRRLLGKAHIGLVYSKKINQLLDDLQHYQNSRIPLKILGSRLMQKQSFTVHNGSADGDMLFLEICDDALILREMSGAIAERWWYERLVNMTYSPKTKMLCLWRRQDDNVHMHKFYTKKCRHLYGCMKAAMERAAARGKVTVAGRDLGGEFPIHDIEHNEGGLLQVRIDGISLLFANRQDFVPLANIKKCNTFGGNVFVLEELNRSTGHLIQRRYNSSMAREIAWSLHRIFSVQMALDECKKRDALDESNIVLRKTPNFAESRIILPLAAAPVEMRRSRSTSPRVLEKILAKGGANLDTIDEGTNGDENNERNDAQLKYPFAKRTKSRSCTEPELLGSERHANQPQLQLNGGSFPDDAKPTSDEAVALIAANNNPILLPMYF